MAQVVLHESTLSETLQATLLRVATKMNPFIAEPHILLAQVTPSAPVSPFPFPSRSLLLPSPSLPFRST